MKNWMTLIGFCIVNYTNALGFGIYSDKISAFANFYNTSEQNIENLYYIGLIIQILFCLPAIRLIQWRLDYAIIASAYLTACSALLCWFSFGNLIIVIASLILNSIAQLFILPTCFYVADIWFPLEKRSLAIGLGFYSNLLGYATGGILTSLLVQSQQQVRLQMFILTIISWSAFIISVSVVRNKPKVKIQATIKVTWSHTKALWRNKLMAYNAIAISVFLGASWSFESSFWLLESLFPSGISSEQIALLNIIWIVAGGTFGIFIPFIAQKKIQITGNYIFYDRICKIIMILGFAGYLIVGMLVRVQCAIFGIYAVLMFAIGIGSLGFYGLIFLSLIQSLYPIPTLLISTIIIAFASIYSLLAQAVNQLFPAVNVYFSMALVVFLPLIYILLTYETNFKRYRYYLNEKQMKFDLLKITQDDEFDLFTTNDAKSTFMNKDL